MSIIPSNQFSNALGLLCSAILVSTPEFKEVFNQIGVGEHLSSAISSVAGCAIVNRFSSVYENIKAQSAIEQNHDFQHALHEAASNCLAEIENQVETDVTFSKGHWQKLASILQPNQESIEVNTYFAEIKKFISNLSIEEVRQPEKSLDKFFEQQESDKGVIDPETARCLNILVREALTKFQYHFTQALKSNSKAKTVYFQALLETSLDGIEKLIKDAAEKEKLLKDLHCIAERTGNQLETLVRIVFAQNESQRNELLALTPKVDEITAKLDSLNQKLLAANTWVPDVVIYQEEVTPLNKFNFKTGYTPFIGREREISQLFDFLDSNAAFSWWMAEAPGGMGKSRLANEICKQAKKEGWLAGFYDLKLGKKPKDYKHLPENLPVFLVVDYALANEQEAADLLKYLHEHIQNEKRLKGQNCQIKIRLMLLDRAFGESWKNKTNEFAATSHLTKDGKPVPLQLQNTNEDLRWPIIHALLTKEAPTKWKSVCEQEHEILESLHALDSQHRPLFALFAAEALMHDSDQNNDLDQKIRAWNKTGLLEAYWQRTLNKIYLGNDIINNNKLVFERILVKNILVRQLRRKDDLRPIVREGISVETVQHEFEKLYWNLSDKEQTEETTLILGLQPDILGEFVVLQYFKKLYVDDRSDEIENILNWAWHTKPEETGWTLSLLHQDFMDEIDGRMFGLLYLKSDLKPNVDPIIKTVILYMIIDDLRSDVITNKNKLIGSINRMKEINQISTEPNYAKFLTANATINLCLPLPAEIPLSEIVFHLRNIEAFIKKYNPDMQYHLMYVDNLEQFLQRLKREGQILIEPTAIKEVLLWYKENFPSEKELQARIENMLRQYFEKAATEINPRRLL